tara:strand:+ start:19 stop:963 length:945 start_codon:yes stop_codon:yes gene_type:complete
MASTIVVDKLQATGGVVFTLPTADGSAGHLLKTNGSAVLSFVADTDTGITDLVQDTTPQLGGDLSCNSSQIQWSKGADVASATALVLLTDGNYFDVSGTVTITSFNTTAVGTQIKLHFDAACILTHHASDLILPSGANITTAAGDEAEFIEYASGDYRCTSYTKASGKPVITDFANADINASAGIAVTKVAAMPYDIGFTAGFDGDMVKEDVAVATYGEMVMARACTITGEVAYVDTAPTGATLIMDIMKNGTTIYASTKPLIAISANTHTVGVATTTALASGDRVTFKITQIGSSEPGEGVRFTLKCKTNTNE